MDSDYVFNISVSGVFSCDVSVGMIALAQHQRWFRLVFSVRVSGNPQTGANFILTFS